MKAAGVGVDDLDGERRGGGLGLGGASGGGGGGGSKGLGKGKMGLAGHSALDSAGLQLAPWLRSFEAELEHFDSTAVFCEVRHLRSARSLARTHARS